MQTKVDKKESCGIPDKKVNRTSGTRQWAKYCQNIQTGCRNSCLYCYSKEMAIRYGRATLETWEQERINEKSLQAKMPKRNGIIMFPSSHDIVPENLNESIYTLKKMLAVGNQVLIVSKPRLECIDALCDELQGYKDHILFRFTIGSADDDVLKFWEPNAPPYAERLECLKLAHSMGYQTSISCEPMLDLHIERVIDAVSPYVTETIWVGKANNLMMRLKINGHGDRETISRATELMEWQSDNNILPLYERLKDNPQIRWKHSMQKVLERNGICIDANGFVE